MSDLNLNEPSDFAALTSVFGQAAGTPTQSSWNIVQATFKNVAFHIINSPGALGPAQNLVNAAGNAVKSIGQVFGASKQAPENINYSAALPQVHDTTGRRKVFYQFPFQDGQTTGDLGRKAFRFEFDVVFFGPNYFIGYQKLYTVLNQATPGFLIHPVLGKIQCVATDWQVTHRNDERNALTMHIVFDEHTYNQSLPYATVSGLATPIATSKPTTFKSAIVAAMNVFQTVTAATTAIRAYTSYAKSLINGVTNLINGVQADVLNCLQSLYLSFSPASVSLSPDLPGLLPVNLGGQALPSGGQQSALYPMTDASNTPFSASSKPSTTNTNTQQAPNTSLTPIQAEALVNTVLAKIETAIAVMNQATPQTVGAVPGQGALDFYPQVLLLKQIAQSLVTACIQGIASSQQTTTTFTVDPTLVSVSIFEVAFAIGLPVNLSDQIRQLNPDLESVNFIPGGTVLNIPIQAAA